MIIQRFHRKRINDSPKLKILTPGRTSCDCKTNNKYFFETCVNTEKRHATKVTSRLNCYVKAQLNVVIVLFIVNLQKYEEFN